MSESWNRKPEWDWPEPDPLLSGTEYHGPEDHHDAGIPFGLIFLVVWFLAGFVAGWAAGKIL